MRDFVTMVQALLSGFFVIFKYMNVFRGQCNDILYEVVCDNLVTEYNGSTFTE